MGQICAEAHMAPQIEAPDRLRYREGGFALVTGPNGSFETMSGRMTKSAGFGARETRCEAREMRSVVTRSQRRAKKALIISSTERKGRMSSASFRATRTSLKLYSVVVPVVTQTVADGKCARFDGAKARCAMKPCPS